VFLPIDLFSSGTIENPPGYDIPILLIDFGRERDQSQPIIMHLYHRKNAIKQRHDWISVSSLREGAVGGKNDLMIRRSIE